MLHRAARTATLLALLTLGACRSSEPGGDKGAAATRTEVVSEPKTGTTPGTDQDAPPASGALSEVHGDKWADADDPQTTGGMVKFKEAWVYVDGRPVGLLREAELPPLPEVWVDQVELLDFKAGDPPPHERTYQVLRWRLSDYFEAVGIDLKKVKAVLLHGGKGTALIPGKDFRRTKDKLLFDLTGNNNLKLRVFLPDSLDLNTSFDRYAAVSVIVDKPMPSTDDENDVVIDGTPIQGIPYYGQPLRGGIRVYLDGRLALVIKRNALGDEGRVAAGEDRWNIAAMLAARGVDTKRVDAADIIGIDESATRVDGATATGLTFTTESQAQGAVTLSNGQETNAILMWSKGKVPPVRVPIEHERY
ncbi:MAG: hypothetical protein H6709_16170 [Kofleriaceae bacterium]|nr:hypothetical protein [Kofleriaceae bacterium]MCB9573616.1 hypothetical protein [Kofleriaceae bacterium]